MCAGCRRLRPQWHTFTPTTPSVALRSRRTVRCWPAALSPGPFSSVREWAVLRRGEILANWERALRNEPLLGIDPLAFLGLVPASTCARCPDQYAWQPMKGGLCAPAAPPGRRGMPPRKVPASGWSTLQRTREDSTAACLPFHSWLALASLRAAAIRSECTTARRPRPPGRRERPPTGTGLPAAAQARPLPPARLPHAPAWR